MASTDPPICGACGQYKHVDDIHPYHHCHCGNDTSVWPLRYEPYEPLTRPDPDYRALAQEAATMLVGYLDDPRVLDRDDANLTGPCNRLPRLLKKLKAAGLEID